ncbi:DNA-directed RNA polymerase III subunit RPC10 [Ooceraea biroi]|uniref:DNA-directed RNA polymerase subunit n=1 Tax=Ooceraea biroi TaxID=2015173 RepID=A0A026WFE9_OOCBI|nr:DNA-directed RNA polymerase III subunit RPC10 [Ooceraea biroi]EZA54787.1 DNA-directed RNA polymerase III subunit RPC10 [Ooceraea biroi]
MVLWFCTCCGNLLKFVQHPEGNRFACPTCPYIYKIKKPIRRRTYFEGPARETVIVDTESKWMGVDSTDERCPKCSHPRAFFRQVQIRSGDEPMTQIYRCCNHECAHTWRID